MNILLNYNFNPDDIADGEFAKLFELRRRDATFAFAYEDNGRLYALRDHLGIVPLFYRWQNGQLRFAVSLAELVSEQDKLNMPGVRAFIAFGTTKLAALISEIGIVPPGAVVEFDRATQTMQVCYQYEMKPRYLPSGARMAAYVQRADELFRQAIKRLIKHETVGMFLSGGIDSALIGIYLKQLGVRINAYTLAPWGKSSSEIAYAEINAHTIGAAQHTIDVLETEDYRDALEALPEIYGMPHGTTTGIGVASIWRKTAIAQEQQLFFGQNSDTMTCSVPAQYLTWFLSFMPAGIRRKINAHQGHRHIVANYLALYTGGLFENDDGLCSCNQAPQMSNIQQLTHAGMYIAHTPSDGEVLSQPAIHADMIISNPYYDMDLVEFCLGLPVRCRLALARKGTYPVQLQKKVFKKLAASYLPRHLVERKKGFTVSFDRDATTREIVSRLPSKQFALELKRTEHRLAAGILQQWCESRRIV